MLPWITANAAEMSEPTGASPWGSVATGPMLIQSGVRPSSTIAAHVRLLKRISITTASGPSGTRARRATTKTTPTMSAASSASIAGESVGTALGSSTSAAFATMIGAPLNCVIRPSWPIAGSE